MYPCLRGPCLREAAAFACGCSGAVREGGAVQTALGDKLREFQNEDNRRLAEGASGLGAAAGGDDGDSAWAARGQAAL